MSTRVFSANWVLPIDREPINYGEVVVEDGIIQDVRPQITPHYEREDFGEAVLMPGLINAHTHIEYSALRGALEEVEFFPWIRSLMDLKTRLSVDDWVISGRLAALEMIAGGITTIGDNTDAGISARVAYEAGLRATVYQEVFGIDTSETVETIISRLDRSLMANARYESDRIRLGVSPHAPYTVRPELFDAIAQYTLNTSLGTSIHVSETGAEADLTLSGIGPFAEMFQRRGIAWTVPGVSPTQYVYDQKALNASTLAVHCVYQSQEDIDLLAASGAAVVHCPKSNAKLAAGIAPLSHWLRTPGLRIALGTDSAVSNNGLDLFEEMRFALLTQRAMQETVEAVTAQQIVRIATLGGAEAMGLANRVGSLTPGKRADIIAVKLDTPHTVPTTNPYSAIAYSCRASDVCLTVCDGAVLYRDKNWTTLNRSSVIAEAKKVREKATAASSN